jgi:hypothetical protein
MLSVVPPPILLVTPPSVLRATPSPYTEPVSPRPSSPAGPTPMRYPLPHLLRFLGMSLPHMEPHERERVKTYTLALMRCDRANATAPVVQDAAYCEQVYTGARLTLRLLATYAPSDEHYQSMHVAWVPSFNPTAGCLWDASVTTQIQLLARNWMQRALIAFEAEHTAIARQCALDLSPSRTPAVPPVLADTWVQCHTFITAKKWALQQCVTLGRAKDFALTMKSLESELLQWTSLVRRWHRLANNTMPEASSPQPPADIDGATDQEQEEDDDAADDATVTADGDCLCGKCHDCEVSMDIRMEWRIDVPDCRDLFGRMESLSLGP